MNPNCPQCGHRFEREEGFFVGSIILAYFVATFLTLPLLLVSIFKFEMELPLALLVACVFIALILPWIYRYSKIAWIQIEEKLYRSFQSKRDEVPSKNRREI